MIKLSQHIESLMLKHDCVIVPDLGGFVTQYVPARRISEEQLFLPPYRSVGFNQQLTINDGLLVQSYMQAYDTNYPDTLKLIDEAVKQLKDQLQTEGQYELSGIGTLTVGIGGQYRFTPCEAGVISPELYGLDAVNVPEYSNAEPSNGETSNQNNGKRKKVHLKRTERDYTISINRELANYVAAAVAAVFFYFIWATPVTKSNPNDRQAASMLYEQIFAPSSPKADTHPLKAESTKVPAQTRQTEGTENVQTPNPEQATARTTKSSAIAQTQSLQTNPRYTLVLASAITQKNAETFSEKLKAQGLTEVRPYRKGHMVRVIYGQYATESEAQKALQKMRKKNAFAEAWILKTE